MIQQPKLIVIDASTDTKQLEDLYTYLGKQEFVAYDCETTGLSKQDTIIGFSVCAEEDKSFYVILHKWNKETNSLEDVYSHQNIAKLITILQSNKLIMHNAIFDCSMAEYFFKIPLIQALHTDTMILAHLLDENRRIGLKELGASMFGMDATKEADEMKASIVANGGGATKDNYELYKADPHLIGKYGAKDAWLTYKLFLELVPELYEQKLDKFFYEDESMPLLRGPTYELNTTGLKVDTQALMSLKKTLEAECAEAKAFIYQEIDYLVKEKYPGTNKSNHFNVGAPQQLSWLLFSKMNLEFNTLTDTGKEACKDLGLKLPYSPGAKREFISECLRCQGNVQKPEVRGLKKTIKAKKFKAPWAYIACDKKALNKHVHKYKWIEKLLEFQKKQKILTTYVKGIESKVKYGIINPSFLQHGTTSGRYSSRNPNFQNLPRDEKRVKQCIVSRPGKLFVGADYSQLEPRVFAYYSNDQRLLRAFQGSSDFYSTIGMEVYDKTDCTPQKEGSPDAFGIKYKRLRDDSKVIALAITYGATAHQLAPLIGKSVQETQEIIDTYLERFPDVAKMMMDSHELAKTNGFVENLFGRKRRMPEAKFINKRYGKNTLHSELPYEIRNILNLSVNHRIQSTGASICNRAAIRFHENKLKAKIDCKIICQVHDSLIVECNEADAEDVAALLQDAMENTVVLETVQLEATPKTGTNLSKV